MKPLFHFLTLFPETISAWLDTSILARAQEKGIFEYQCHNVREYCTAKERADDVAYGGGGGMVLRAEPLVLAIESIQKSCAYPIPVIYFSPGGKKISQDLLKSHSQALRSQNQIILVCGHYEGVDQRFIENWVTEEISIGDFVVTGGELPALIFADAVIRKLGSISSEREKEESFSLFDSEGPLLEYPHYTRPAEFRGQKVPEVLLSGNHENIRKWREMKSKEKTRPSK